MTTPDTSAVRAWARSNGYDVADRGRLPAELTDAYLAAQGGKAGPSAKAPATKAPARKAPARGSAGTKPAARNATAKKAAPASEPTAKTAPKPVAKAAAAAAPASTSTPAPASAPAATTEPKPRPVNDDRRLVALGEQLTALTARVAELEKSLGSKPSGNGVAKRFRRSR